QLGGVRVYSLLAQMHAIKAVADRLEIVQRQRLDVVSQALTLGSQILDDVTIHRSERECVTSPGHGLGWLPRVGGENHLLVLEKLLHEVIAFRIEPDDERWREPRAACA